MNSTSSARTEGPVDGSVRDQVDLLEARMWDRARLNLMLLYKGRRIGSSAGQGPANRLVTAPLVDGNFQI